MKVLLPGDTQYPGFYPSPYLRTLKTWLIRSLRINGYLLGLLASVLSLSQTDVMSTPPLAAEPSLSNEKKADFGTLEKVHYSTTDVESTTKTDTAVLQTERDIVTHVISVCDDPSLNPWTFRSFFLGIALSAFGGVLGERHFCSRGTTRTHELQRTAEIYYFKPVSNIPVLLVQIKFRSSTANRLCLYDVPRNHQLRAWNCF